MKKLSILLLALMPVACAPPPTRERCQVDAMQSQAGMAFAGHMALVKDSPGCNIRFRQNGEQYLSIDVRQKPDHGKVRVWNQTDGSIARYTPAPGYTGPDSFQIGLGPTWGAIVRADVLP